MDNTESGSSEPDRLLIAASWIPFGLLALMTLALMSEPPVVPFAFGAAALVSCPPLFRRLPIPPWAKIAAAVALLVIAGWMTPTDTRKAKVAEPTADPVVTGGLQSEMDHWTKRQKEAVYACRALIQENLRDPSSVDWISIADQNQASRAEDGGYVVMQKVRTNNGFGGKTVSIYLCKTHPGEGKWILDDLREMN